MQRDLNNPGKTFEEIEAEEWYSNYEKNLKEVNLKLEDDCSFGKLERMTLAKAKKTKICLKCKRIEIPENHTRYCVNCVRILNYYSNEGNIYGT